MTFFHQTGQNEKSEHFFQSEKSPFFLKPQEQAPNFTKIEILPQCGCTFPLICVPRINQHLQNKCKLSPTFFHKNIFSFLAVASDVILTRASGVLLTRGRPLKSAPTLQCTEKSTFFAKNAIKNSLSNGQNDKLAIL